MEKRRSIFPYSILLLLFVWYIGGISLFPHTHIVDGASIVHSHPNPDAGHQGEESFITIHLLTQFQSCETGAMPALPELSVILLPEYDGIRDVSWPVCRDRLRVLPGGINRRIKPER